MTTRSQTPSEPDPAENDDRSPPTVLRLRTPEDLLAAVPVLLGFEPRESLVLLTFPGAAGPPGPHLRVDLPTAQAGGLAADEAVAELIELVLHPCLRHRVDGVAMVLYTDHREMAGQVADELREQFAPAGVGVLVIVHTDGRRWWELASRPGGERAVPGGSMRRVRDHPIRADAVLRGEVVLSSREELAASLQPAHSDLAAEVHRAVLAERRRSRRRLQPEEALWVSATLGDLVENGAGAAMAPTLARLLCALEIGVNRDAAWRGLVRANAAAHREVWVELLRLAPAGTRAGPASLAALASWLHGDGALAWCAVDICLAEAPRHGLGALMRDLLSSATAPSWWEEVAAQVQGDLA